jgi:hypothetical protein
MLVITQRQMDILNRAVHEQHEARLVCTLQAEVPDTMTRLQQAGGGERVAEAVCEAREHAARFGISDDADAAVFVAFTITSRDFDAARNARFRAWVMPVLERSSTSGTAKLALIERTLRSNAAADPLARSLCELASRVRRAYTGQKTP